MTSSFFRQAAQGLLSPAIDQYMGEEIVLKGMVTRANASPTPDPTRPAVTIRGVFKWETLAEGTGSDARQNHHYTSGGAPLKVITRNPVFSFALVGLPKIVRGDRLMRTVDGTQWEVVTISPDGVHRTCIKVVQLGVPNTRDAS